MTVVRYTAASVVFALLNIPSDAFGEEPCKLPEARVYTLYRESTEPGMKRIHIATFDADQAEDYNQKNCEIARILFQGQKGVVVRYWCEKGRYHS